MMRQSVCGCQDSLELLQTTLFCRRSSQLWKLVSTWLGIEGFITLFLIRTHSRLWIQCCRVWGVHHQYSSIVAYIQALLQRDWIVHVGHTLREANSRIDQLTQEGSRAETGLKYGILLLLLLLLILAVVLFSDVLKKKEKARVNILFIPSILKLTSIQSRKNF